MASRKSVHLCLFALDSEGCGMQSAHIACTFSWSSLNIFQDEDGAALSAFPEDNGKGVLLR